MTPLMTVTANYITTLGIDCLRKEVVYAMKQRIKEIVLEEERQF